MKRPVFIALAVLTLALLACSLVTTSSTESSAVDEPLPAELKTAFDALPTGDAARGEQIFTVAQPCHTCHMDLPLGPPFSGEPPMATLAATRRPGYTAEVYLYESIVNPNAYLVPGFQEGIMPEELGETLTEQDLADLVAYLLTMQ